MAGHRGAYGYVFPLLPSPPNTSLANLTPLPVAVSFPPLIGHTTITTLCGFAYGMKGFFISAVGSLVGSALVFIALRLLFSHRLKSWASGNEKWQALESVVVCTYGTDLVNAPDNILSARQGPPAHHPHPRLALPAMGVLEHLVCCAYFLTGTPVGDHSLTSHAPVY